MNDHLAQELLCGLAAFLLVASFACGMGLGYYMGRIDGYKSGVRDAEVLTGERPG